MGETTEIESVQLLRDLRDGQRLQLERQAEALALQREQVELVRQQFDRAERLQAKAEALQDRGTQAMRIVMFVLIPLALLLVGVVFLR